MLSCAMSLSYEASCSGTPIGWNFSQIMAHSVTAVLQRSKYRAAKRYALPAVGSSTWHSAYQWV